MVYPCQAIKPQYRLELKGVNAKELGGVMKKDFGDFLQDAGIKTVIVDNDRKRTVQQYAMSVAWCRCCW